MERQIIKALLQLLDSGYVPRGEGATLTDADIIARLCRLLERSSAVTRGAGPDSEVRACQFRTSSGIQCVNLTEAECNAIPGKWDPHGRKCEELPGDG